MHGNVGITIENGSVKLQLTGFRMYQSESGVAAREKTSKRD